MNKRQKRPTLEQLQKWMSRAVTHPQEAEALELGWVESKTEVPAEARLSVYSTAYLARITEVMEKDFPLIRRILGYEAFSAMASVYLKKHPSRYTHIGEVARDLPAFLSTYEAVREHPYLSSLALLEWKMAESFWADERPALDFSKLKNINEQSWKDARFELDPSIKFVESPWPIYEIWKIRAGGAVNCPDSAQTEYLMLRRDDGGDVHVHRLIQSAFELLQGLNRGDSLYALSEAFKNRPDAPTAEQIEQWFREWTQNGVIKNIIMMNPTKT